MYMYVYAYVYAYVYVYVLISIYLPNYTFLHIYQITSLISYLLT